MIAIDSLIAFAAIIDCGSFSAAAVRLQQTPSGVSRTLSRLEKQLGVTLIVRTTRRLDLTEEGRWLLGRAREILSRLEETEAQLRANLARPSGLVRVNAATPVLNHLISPHVAGFIEAYPAVRLELTGAETIVDLIAERADVAIRVGALPDSTLNARLLGESRLRLVAAPSYLQRRGTPLAPAALAAHQVLGFTQPSSLNLWPLSDGERTGWPIAPTLTASSGETLRHLALDGAGIACLADFLIGEDMRAGRVVPVLADSALPWAQPVWAVFYAPLAPRSACFVDYLAKRIALSR
ncbi:LysR family transcriptional regulator [Paludibacterium yongneupense]|uniref:LysR family transcriptional regulator n=1 Tax=Paludibacterium yongneupense TaxID=400061 RepID=UPI0004916B07|nr:LysR family transcriptional regulator [Paludibacterium yongneupense]